MESRLPFTRYSTPEGQDCGAVKCDDISVLDPTIQCLHEQVVAVGWVTAAGSPIPHTRRPKLWGCHPPFTRYSTPEGQNCGAVKCSDARSDSGPVGRGYPSVDFATQYLHAQGVAVGRLSACAMTGVTTPFRASSSHARP